MAETKLRSLTMTSEGQVTRSAKARKELGLDQGDTLIEMVVGNCIVLCPKTRSLPRLRGKLRKQLSMPA